MVITLLTPLAIIVKSLCKTTIPFPLPVPPKIPDHTLILSAVDISAGAVKTEP